MGTARIAAAFACGSTLLIAGAATAQDASTWVVIGAGTEAQADDLDRWTGRIETELRGAGHRVVDRGAVAQAVRAQLSAPYEAAPTDLLRELSAAVEPAVFDAASGRSRAVRDRADPLIERALPHLAALNRSAEAFTDLGNLCYVVVRSHLYERNRDAARSAALRCLRAVPGFAAWRLHPPDVRQLHAELAELVDQGNVASLTVQTPPDRDAACAVHVNGRPAGRTPMVRQLLPDGDYVVDLTCDDDPLPRRIHRVHVEQETPARVVVDPLLDRAIGSSPVLLLYPTSRGVPEVSTLHDHARAIGDAAGAGGILVVTGSGGNMEVQRVPTSVRAFVRADQSGGDELRRALAAVVAGRSYGAPGTGTRGSTSDEATRTRRRPIVGPLILGIAGIGAIVAVVTAAVIASCDERYADGACRNGDRLSPLAAGLYGTAGGLALTGAVLWLVLGGRSEGPTGDARVGLGVGSLHLEVDL
jgi:hypothetical protein